MIASIWSDPSAVRGGAAIGAMANLATVAA
jgi:hypothetical protein